MVEKTGESGVITGVSSPLDNSLVTLSFLSSNSNLKPGQESSKPGAKAKFFRREF